MDWIFFAFLAPLLWVVSNYIDKLMISKYFENKLGALMVFSSVVALVIVPFVYFFQPHVLNIDLVTMVIVILNSFLLLIYLFPYFWSLRDEDTSNVTPLFQTIPFFVMVLSFVFLKETLSVFQVLAVFFVAMGAFLISLRTSGKKLLFKKRVLVLMLCASFLVALNSVIFKFFALELDFWTVIFWQYIGAVIFGLILLVFVKDYRKQFFSVFRKQQGYLIGVNLVNELLNFGAWMAFSFATLLAPVAIIWMVNGIQPFLVILFGFFLTKFFPKIQKEDIGGKSIVRKVIAVLMMLIGLAMLQL